MKKIAIILGKFCAVNLFDFNHIYDSIRGLSGTDTILVEISKEFNKRGWDVSIFTCSFPNQPKEWFGCKIYDIERRFDVIQNDWTAIISINDPRDFIGLPDKPLKLFSQQLNGVSYLPPGWENLFDIATSPSQAHLDHHKSMYTQLHKWNVVEDACTYDPDLDLNKKISGRIIWTSSPDRGLHWLISIYPNIKKRVPHASLKVFYNFNFSAIEDCETQTGTMGLDILEIAQRVRYIKEMVPRLKDLDVEHIGAVSKNQIIEEYKKAEVFPFTCDPTQWTEGFSISTAEAINYGLVTLVSDKDALPSVYKDCAQIIEGKLKDSLQKWEDAIVKALTDETYKKQMILKGRDFARNHDWSIMVDKLEKLILSHPKLKTDTESKDMIKLNICSGPNVFPYPGWINLDREDISPYLNYLRSVSNIEAMPQSQKDLVKYLQAGGTIDFRIHDARKKTNFDDNSIEIIYLGQAIEHFAPLREIPFLLSECYRILKPGGVLRITTPDLDLLINCYLENDMNKFANEQPGLYKDSDAASQLAMLMYGSLGPNTTYDCYDGHQFLFTQKSLTSFLEKAKFKDIEFYNTAGKSKNKIMEQECNDAGVSHSLIVECVK